MKDRKNEKTMSHSDLLIKIKECLSKFEELRGYL